jgi:hypothetical protein
MVLGLGIETVRYLRYGLRRPNSSLLGRSLHLGTLRSARAVRHIRNQSKARIARGSADHCANETGASSKANEAKLRNLELCWKIAEAACQDWSDVDSFKKHIGRVLSEDGFEHEA